MNRSWYVAEEKTHGLGEMLNWLSEKGWQVHSIHSNVIAYGEDTEIWFTIIAYRDDPKETNR